MSLRLLILVGSAIAGAVMAAAVALGAVAGFPDVPEDHRYADDIAIVADRGWFVGFEDGTFGPDREGTLSQTLRVFSRVFAEVNPTRAGFAAVLRAGVEHMNAIAPGGAPDASPPTAPPASETARPFPDVPSDHPYADDVVFAVDRGWLVVDEGGLFGPDREFDRSQARAVFTRMLADISPTRAEFASIMRAGVDAVYPPPSSSVDLPPPAPAPDAPDAPEPTTEPPTTEPPRTVPPQPNFDPGCGWIFNQGTWMWEPATC